MEIKKVIIGWVMILGIVVVGYVLLRITPTNQQIAGQESNVNYCQTLGKIAGAIAVSRDLGITRAETKATLAKDQQQSSVTLVTVLMVTNSVYDFPDLSPDKIEALTLKECVDSKMDSKMG